MHVRSPLHDVNMDSCSISMRVATKMLTIKEFVGVTLEPLVPHQLVHIVGLPLVTASAHPLHLVPQALTQSVEPVPSPTVLQRLVEVVKHGVHPDLKIESGSGYYNVWTLTFLVC